MTGSRSTRTIALALLAIVPTLFFADVLTGFTSFYARDVSQYHYPLKHILREIVLSGEFPWWNPYLSGGQPLAANPAHQVFYPLNWLILLPSYRIGFHLLALAHIYLALFGMYALLRSMRLSRGASVVGGISFGLGGLLVSTMCLFPFLFSAAWIPWVVLFARRAIASRSRRDFVFASLCLGMQFLIGEPTTSLQTCMLIGIHAIAHGFRDGGRATTRAIAVAVAIGFAALAVSAVQILPGVDHFRDSTRGRGLDWQFVRAWSTPPVRFAELFYPDLLGNPLRHDRHSYWGVSHYQERQLPFFFGIYPSLLVTVLAAGGLLVRARGSRIFLVAALASLVLALGDRTPLLRILYDAGVATAIRYPEKFLIMGIFAIVVFGAVVIDRLWAGDTRVRRVALIVTGVVAAVALAAALVASTSIHEPLFRSFWRVPEGIDVHQMMSAARTGWWIAALRAAILLALLAMTGRVSRSTSVAMSCAFVAIDLGLISPRLAPRYSSSYYEDPPAVVRQFPRNRTHFRIFHAGDLFTGKQTDPYYEPRPETYWLTRNALAPPFPATYGLRMAASSDYDLTALQASDDFVVSALELGKARAPGWIGAISAMSNVWYVGFYRPPQEAFAEAHGDLRNVQPVRFLEIRHFPRYYFATELVAIRDRKELVRHIAQQQFTPGTAFTFAHSGRPSHGIVLNVREWSHGARLEVEAVGMAFLVMSVTPHKYWTITIDGAETDAVVTNVGYQGVFVPGGRHVVEMRYRNPLIPAGAAISIGTLVLLALIGSARRLTADSAARDDQHITAPGDPGDSPT